MTIRISADRNRWASLTITWVRITPISAASCRSENPSSACADASTRHTASTSALSVSVVSRGVIRRSAYAATAAPPRPSAATSATTTSAGTAPCSRSPAEPPPRTGFMAWAVAVSSTAAERPVTIWQPSSSRTACRSVRQDSRAMRPRTAGICPHILRNETSASGLTEYCPP